MAINRMKQQENKNRSARSFQEGDMVLVLWTSQDINLIKKSYSS